MADHTIIIETESGETYRGDIRDIEFEAENVYSGGAVVTERESVYVSVGELFQESALE